MHRTRRALRTGIALAAVTMAVAACGGNGGAAPGGADQAGGPDLLIWTGGGPGGDATKKLAQTFAQQYGVNVTVQIVPKELQTQFVTASQAGNAPDVVFGAHDWIGNLVQNGAIDPVPMTQELTSSFEELAVKAVTFNGQTYGIPFTRTCRPSRRRCSKSGEATRWCEGGRVRPRERPDHAEHPGDDGGVGPAGQGGGRDRRWCRRCVHGRGHGQDDPGSAQVSVPHP